MEREGFCQGDKVRFMAGGREVEGVVRTFTGKSANQKYPFTAIANGDAYALRSSDMTLVEQAKDASLAKNAVAESLPRFANRDSGGMDEPGGDGEAGISSGRQRFDPSLSTIQHHPLCSIRSGKPCDYDCARDYPQQIAVA